MILVRKISVLCRAVRLESAEGDGKICAGSKGAQMLPAAADARTAS
jgi:hypothetical protein